MNTQRVFAVFYKDFQWARFNTKLLTLTLIPPLLSVFFQLTAKGSLSAFSIIFNFAMIGLLLGSYLITEEKRIESLKSALVTPLSFYELTFGKFLLPTALCLMFSFFNFLIDKNLKMFFNPTIFISLVLMSSIVCALGIFMGLVARNEQELGVVGPFFLLIFMGGTIFSKTKGLAFASYFPDFHFVHLLENYKLLTQKQIALHLLFLLSFFIFTILLISRYIQFFFSSDNETKRIDGKTSLWALPIVALHIFSGQAYKQFELNKNHESLTTANYKLQGNALNTELTYDPTNWQFISLSNKDGLTEGEKNMIMLKSAKDLPIEMTVGIKILSATETTFEDRKKKLEADGSYFLIKKEQLNHKNNLLMTVYSLDDEYKTSYEVQCNDELLRFSFTHPKDAKYYAKADEALLKLATTATISCP